MPVVFLSPWFFLLLIPWAGLTIHLFRGARTNRNVPFLNFWRGPIKPKPAAPSFRPPDAAIILSLLALLFAIFACTKPAIHAGERPISRPGSIYRPPLVRIDYIAARETPRPQLMLRLSQEFPFEQDVDVRINSITKGVHLAAREQTFFIDLDHLEDSIDISTNGDHATIRRQSAFPRLIVAIGDPHIQKFAEIYNRARPASAQSRQIVIGRDILLSSCDIIPKVDRFDVATHPITAHLDWPRILATAKITTQTPPPSWRPLISQGETVLLAESPDDSRKIWLGFSTDPIVNTDDFVILWTNIVNYVGHATEGFTTYQKAEVRGQEAAVPENPKPRVISNIFLMVAVGLLSVAFLTFSRGGFTVVSAAGIGN